MPKQSKTDDGKPENPRPWVGLGVLCNAAGLKTLAINNVSWS
jgi:hypothetical protein